MPKTKTKKPNTKLMRCLNPGCGFEDQVYKSATRCPWCKGKMLVKVEEREITTTTQISNSPPGPPIKQKIDITPTIHDLNTCANGTCLETDDLKTCKQCKDQYCPKHFTSGRCRREDICKYCADGQYEYLKETCEILRDMGKHWRRKR